jgi:hypothetical protein
MNSNPLGPLDYENANAFAATRPRRWLIRSVGIGIFSICGSFGWAAITWAGQHPENDDLATKINVWLWPPPDQVSRHPWTIWIYFFLPSLCAAFIIVAAVSGRKLKIWQDPWFWRAIFIVVIAFAIPIAAQILFGILALA